MTFLANLLAQLVVGVVKTMYERADFRAAVLREVEKQGAEDAIKAMGWKADHPVELPDDPRDVFRVLDGAGEVRLPAEPPRPPGPGV